MEKFANEAPVGEVSVDHGTLALVDLGRGRGGCSVLLDGAIDKRWAEIFAQERRESWVLSRFELDQSTRTVSFAREAGSDPADVMEALEVLDALVERVSRRAFRAPLSETLGSALRPR